MAPSEVNAFAYYKDELRKQSPLNLEATISSTFQNQPEASTLTSNAPAFSSDRIKTPILIPNAASFRSSGVSHLRSVSPSTAVSSAELPPGAPSQPVHSWWTLAEDKTCGYNQFAAFHKEKLKVKSTGSELKVSTSGSKYTPESSQRQTLPVISPARKLSPSQRLPQRSPFPSSFEKYIPSPPSPPKACLQQVAPQQSSKHSTIITHPTINNFRRDSSANSLQLLASNKRLQSTLPATKHISSQPTSQQLAFQQQQHSTPLLITSPLRTPDSVSAMQNPADGFDAFAAWKTPKSSAMQVQDSNKKVTGLHSQPGKADDSPSKVKAMTDSPTASQSGASTQHHHPHMRMMVNNASSPTTSSDAVHLRPSPTPTTGMKINGDSTPTKSLAATRILPHMQVKVKNGSPSTIATGGQGARLLPHMMAKAKDERAPVQLSAGAGSQVLPHLKVKTKNDGPPGHTTSTNAKALLDEKPKVHDASRPSSAGCVTTHDVKTPVKNLSRPTTSSDGWGAHNSFDAKVMHEMILQDVKDLNHIPDNDTFPLTEEAIMKATGSTPRKPQAKTLAITDVVSETGLSDDHISEDRPREGVRATQGRSAAEELLDWDGKTWIPPPEDWEGDRPACNTVFLPAFLAEWIGNCRKFPNRILDTAAEEFKNSVPVKAGHFGEVIEQPDSKPDIAYSYDEDRRLSQTSASESKKLMEKQHKAKVSKKMYRDCQEARDRECAQMALNPEPNPFSPTIEVYLRPATELDAPGVAEIYNFYVEKSRIPEDQARISIDDAKAMIIAARSEHLPFLVAIKGKKPALHDKQGRAGATKKATMPLFEAVIGFANAETFNYSFTGARNGRSRTTTSLQLYVHADYRRKGIGRNLLDRLVHILNPGYTYESACPWSNPGNCKAHEAGGAGSWHQMIFLLAVMPPNDPNLTIVKHFLYQKNNFREAARLHSIARTSTSQGPAKYYDLVYFQAEASPAEYFDPYA